jgi:hypothetical protein
MARNVVHGPAPSMRAASYNAGSICCSPASSSSATNGVIRHTSAEITGTHAVTAPLNHCTG